MRMTNNKNNDNSLVTNDKLNDKMSTAIKILLKSKYYLDPPDFIITSSIARALL